MNKCISKRFSLLQEKKKILVCHAVVEKKKKKTANGMVFAKAKQCVKVGEAQMKPIKCFLGTERIVLVSMTTEGFSV